MSATLRIVVAGALVAASIGVPWMLRHQAQVALRARHDVLEQQASRLSLLVEENGRLSNLVAQAKASSLLTAEQLRELLRLRNEKRWLAEQTNLAARLATGTSDPAQLSPAELRAALCAEMIEAMKRISPALQAALQKYALAHPNQRPGSLSELQDYFPLVDGRKMVGLQTFKFARDEGPRPGDALLLRGDPGSRPGAGPEVRIYGFSDGRVLEVSSEDGHFDDWEHWHLTAAPTGTEEKILLEAAGTAQERAHLTELAASVGISAEDASRFFDQFKQWENALNQKSAEAQKDQTGSSEEAWSQMRSSAEAELARLASQTLGDKGPALVRKMAEGK
jgi:hypothetical protein